MSAEVAHQGGFEADATAGGAAPAPTSSGEAAQRLQQQAGAWVGGFLEDVQELGEGMAPLPPELPHEAGSGGQDAGVLARPLRGKAQASQHDAESYAEAAVAAARRRTGAGGRNIRGLPSRICLSGITTQQSTRLVCPSQAPARPPCSPFIGLHLCFGAIR